MNTLIIHFEIYYLHKRTCSQLSSPEDCETNMKLRVANKINEIALLYRLETRICILPKKEIAGPK